MEYSLTGYGKMVADQERVRAYAAALEKAVRPGSVVLDIGAGTGILSLLACKFGARHVYAVEPSEAISLAADLARANGLESRIQCIRGLSTEIDLPEKADVIVSDLRGVLPLFERHIPSILDARLRFLAPSGTLIPQKDVIWTAIVETPEAYEGLVRPWVSGRFNLNMAPASEFFTNRWQKLRAGPEQLLTEACRWATIDYNTLISPDVIADMEFKARRNGVAHGFISWFDAILNDDIGFSNAPGKPELIYGSGFFPWPNPVELEAGDTISITLRADLIGRDYVWSWESRIVPKAGPMIHFRQSTFFGQTIAPGALRKVAGSYLPKVTGQGQIDRRILQLMDGLSSNTAIAEKLVAEFPSRFASSRDALTRIAQVVETYGE